MKTLSWISKKSRARYVNWILDLMEQSRGVRRMDTMISGSNSGILNTYISFGYTVQKSFF
jgi:hypothetical protein